MSDYKITGSPDEIWLNYGDIDRDETHQNCARDGDITWCEEAVFYSDIKYVRADLVESLRQKLANEFDKREALDNELADHLKREVMLRDRLKDALWDETRWRVEAGNALAATADLENVRLCEKKPVARAGVREDGSLVLWSSPTTVDFIPLYRAWRPK